MRDPDGGRENVYVVYRMADGREAETIVTPRQRNALLRAGRLVEDRGDVRYLASAGNWSNMFALGWKRPRS